MKTSPTGLQHSEFGSASMALQRIINVGAGAVGAGKAFHLKQLGAEVLRLASEPD